MQIGNRTLDWILDSRHRWIQHTLFWGLMYLPHIAAILGLTDKQVPASQLPFYFFLLAIDIALVYFNLYYLLPQFFFKKEYVRYIVFATLALFINAYIGPAVHLYMATNGQAFAPQAQEVLNSFVLTFNVTMTALAFHIIKRFLRNQARLKQLENSSLLTELAFLKHQINPHFLFNSLNNIYVKSRTNPNEASESILQLADLLRYQLYDCGKEKVNLHDEIDYLQNYLEIDKMRKNKAAIDFKVKGAPNGIKVAPFLFIPFVENALKHGINLSNETRIRIQFDIQSDEVVFEIENSKPEMPHSQRVKGGIGLANISRRLDLLYPGRYRLDIDNEKRYYKVRLSISPN